MKGLLCFFFRVWVGIYMSLPFVLERCAYFSLCSRMVIKCYCICGILRVEFE